MNFKLVTRCLQTSYLHSQKTTTGFPSYKRHFTVVSTPTTATSTTTASTPDPKATQYPEMVFEVPHSAAESAKELLQLEENHMFIDSISLYTLLVDIGMPELQKKLAKDEIERTLLPKISTLVNMPADKFNQLFSDPIQRNRVKVFLRNITHSPISSDPIPIVVPTISTTQIPIELKDTAVRIAKHAWIRNLKLPELLSASETGSVEQWCYELLEEFSTGDEICAVDTTIGTFNIEAPEDGYFSEYLLQIGEEVPVNTDIAILVHHRQLTDAPIVKKSG